MNVTVTKKFIKQVKDLPKSVQLTTKEVIDMLRAADSLHSINSMSIKKLKGGGSFYRIRIQDYRIGFSVKEDQTIVLQAAAHRKTIYNIFPS